MTKPDEIKWCPFRMIIFQSDWNSIEPVCVREKCQWWQVYNDGVAECAVNALSCIVDLHLKIG